MSLENQWNEVIKRLSLGDQIKGTVIENRPYGVFLNIGEGEILGFIRIVNVRPANEGPTTLKDLPVIGTELIGTIVDIAPYQINVSLLDNQPG